MTTKIDEIRNMWEMQQGFLPVGVKQELLEAILDLDDRITKLESKTK